jgi:hypothetical protein
MWDQRLNELIFLLAVVSLVSWGIVIVTALIRTAARWWYRQRKPRLQLQQLQQQIEEATE